MKHEGGEVSGQGRCVTGLGMVDGIERARERHAERESARGRHGGCVWSSGYWDDRCCKVIGHGQRSAAFKQDQASDTVES